MKIGLFTDTYYPEVNGVATSTLLLKKELERLGHVVYVFTVTNPNVVEKEENVFRMISLPFVFLQERRFCFDTLHRWIGTIEGLKLDVIHTQTEFVVGQIGKRAAKKLNIPHIHTYHTIYEEYTHYLKVPGNAKLKNLIRNMSRKWCDEADEVIVPTKKVQDLLQNYGVRKSLIVQPTGIDIRKFGIVSHEKLNEIRRKYGIDRKNHVLISVGRLCKEKDVFELLLFTEQVMKQDPKARLFFVGDGPEREKMETYVHKNHLERRVFFTGEVEWKNVQNYYAIANIYVGNSTSETQGLTNIEALAAGKPLLVRKDDCQNSFLVKGVNGYNFQDYDEFVKYYNALFSNKNYQKMEMKARESVTEWSSEAFARNMEGIYTNLIEQKKMPQQKREELYAKVQSVAG